MLIFVYVIAVLVSLVFERQERRHLFEESLEYQRIGKEPPQPKPKLPLIESWLNVTVGIFLLLFGILAVWSQLFVLSTVHDAAERTLSGDDIITSSVFIAGGIALILLGLKSVRFHMHLNKNVNKRKNDL